MVSKPAQISEDEDFTLYEWNEEDTFIKHTKAMIDESISNAERRNQVKIDGESTEETYDVFEGLFGFDNQGLTDEDRELVEEFLQTC